MIDKEQLLVELDKEYKELKSSHKIKVSLEDLDQVFSIKEATLKEGFVSTRLSRQVCHRIIETYMGWNEYLHSLIMPNPQNMLNLSESKILNHEERKEIGGIMKKIMELVSRNNIISLTQDSKSEAIFIDDAIKFWKEEFTEKIGKVMERINNEWKESNENT